MKRLAFTLVLALPGLASAQEPAPKPAQAPTKVEGVKLTERFIKASGDAVQGLAEAKLQLQTTLASYNALVNELSKDRRGDYKKLQKAVVETNKRVSETQLRLATMDGEANAYFDGWTGSLENITNPDLRKRSAERLEDSEKRYAGILAALQQARKEFDPFMTALGDQITYLGHDLNPSAAASLKPDQLKLNERGEKVFARADDAIRTANDYIRALRPE
jgi:ElaB/YqjD/DUF883 family membrane-anchored ribosome-binding protein